MKVIRVPLAEAIEIALGKKKIDGYDRVMKATDLAKLMGMSGGGTAMIYNYRTGKTKKIQAARAWLLFRDTGILIDQWDSPDELEEEAEKSNLKDEIQFEMVKGITGKIEEILTLTELDSIKRELRKILAQYY